MPGHDHSKIRRCKQVDEKEYVQPPPFHSLTGMDRDIAAELCLAMYEAVLSGTNPKGVWVSSIGSHAKVIDLKKAPQFANQRLADIVARHYDIFWIDRSEEPDKPSHWRVNLLPNAQSNLPSAVGASVDETAIEEGKKLLPERPWKAGQSVEERLQNLRIEVIYALFERGGRAFLNDFAQTPEIRAIVRTMPNTQAKGGMVTFLEMFPSNFHIEDRGNGINLVTLMSADTSEAFIADKESGYFAEASGYVKARPKGSNKGGNWNTGFGKGAGKGKGWGQPYGGDMMQKGCWEMQQGMMKGMAKGMGKEAAIGFAQGLAFTSQWSQPAQGAQRW